MADCDMTLDLDDPSGDPIANGAIGVAPAVAAAVPGGGKLIAAEKLYALSDPYNVVTFIRGQLYRWREYKPHGATFFAYCPNTPAANYSALVPTIPIPPGPGVIGDLIINSVIEDDDSQTRSTLEHLFVRVLDTEGNEINDGVVTLTVERPMGNRIKNISFEED